MTVLTVVAKRRLHLRLTRPVGAHGFILAVCGHDPCVRTISGLVGMPGRVATRAIGQLLQAEAAALTEMGRLARSVGRLLQEIADSDDAPAVGEPLRPVPDAESRDDERRASAGERARPASSATALSQPPRRSR